MKFLRYFIMGVLLIGITGIASATKFQILDPPSGDSPFFVVQPGTPFSFGFADCDVTLDGQQYTGCALGFNDSDKAITNLTLSFADTVSAPDCSSNAFSDCGFVESGGVYVLTFQDGCGSDSCGIAPYSFIVVLEDGVPGSDFPDVAGIANTPEPSSLLLALSSMGPLGYLVRRRRRNPRA